MAILRMRCVLHVPDTQTLSWTCLLSDVVTLLLAHIHSAVAVHGVAEMSSCQCAVAVQLLLGQCLRALGR